MNATFTADKFTSFWELFRVWLKKGWMLFAGILALMLGFQHFFMVGVNASKSLEQYSVFLVLKFDKDIKRGDLVAFHYEGENPYEPSLLWVKRAEGVAGDVVTRSNRTFFVNGKEVGTAAERGKTGRLYGKELPLGPVGEIPQGFFYVKADHPDSLDSRYGLMGWLAQAKVVGRAIVLF